MIDPTSYVEAGLIIALFELEAFDRESVWGIAPQLATIYREPGPDGFTFACRCWFMDKQEDTGLSYDQANQMAMYIAERVLSLRKTFGILAVTSLIDVLNANREEIAAIICPDPQLPGKVTNDVED